jgi:hypothetical protein
LSIASESLESTSPKHVFTSCACPTNNRVKWACNYALIIFSGSTSSFAVPVMIST